MESLPNEILSKVFEELDYFDLKLTLPAVCKRFRQCLAAKSKTGPVDKILFRDQPSGKAAAAAAFLDEDDYQIHPALILLDFRFTGKMEDIIFQGLNGRPDYNLPETNLGIENAVTPAVSEMELRFDSEYNVLVNELKNESGVTVDDVMRAVANFFKGEFWEGRKWNGDIFLEVERGKLRMYLDGFFHVPGSEPWRPTPSSISPVVLKSFFAPVRDSIFR